MLELAILSLVCLIGAATAVWLYRLVFNWRGFNKPIAGNPGNKTRIRLKVQRGFIALVAPPRKSAKHKTLRSPQGGIKAPWGW
jgi:hypothetical protein